MTGLYLCAPVLLSKLILDAAVNTKIVEANRCTYERRPAPKLNFERSPEYPPTPNEDNECAYEVRDQSLVQVSKQSILMHNYVRLPSFWSFDRSRSRCRQSE